MDKSAIEQIQESANTPELIAQLKTDHPVALTPKSMDLSSLEKYMTNANSYRLTFRTSSIADFCEYNKQFDKKGARCFINPDDMSAETIFDLGTDLEPLHQQNKAQIKLKKTAIFAEISKLSGAKLSQQLAAEFIEDWGEFLSVTNNEGNEMELSLAAKSFRDLTIEAARQVNSKVNDFGANMSSMEKIEAQNQSQIPAFISVTCIPFHHMQQRTFIMRVSILTTEKPQILLRITKLESVEESMAEEFKKILEKSFEDLEIESFIGNAN